VGSVEHIQNSLTSFIRAWVRKRRKRRQGEARGVSSGRLHLAMEPKMGVQKDRAGKAKSGK